MSPRAGWTRPVIIIGAPRSGTSLLQQVIRGYPGFASLAKESDFIWERYTHPSLHGWVSETWSPESVNAAEITRIHRAFARYALPAKAWRRLDRFGVLRYQRSPLLSAFLRPAYHAFAGLRGMTSRIDERTRLVEKSVHSALYLGLLERVFPDALYLHIVREPKATIASMTGSWMNPNRFFTYELPVSLQIPGYSHDRWNFALPPQWERYIDRSVPEIAAFQWKVLQEKILEFSDQLPGDRYLRIRLEDMVRLPGETLRRVSTFAGLGYNGYLEGFAKSLPEVNREPEATRHAGYEPAIEEAAREVASVAERLGYGRSR